MRAAAFLYTIGKQGQVRARTTSAGTLIGGISEVTTRVAEIDAYFAQVQAKIDAGITKGEVQEAARGEFNVLRSNWEAYKSWAAENLTEDNAASIQAQVEQYGGEVRRLEDDLSGRLARGPLPVGPGGGPPAGPPPGSWGGPPPSGPPPQGGPPAGPPPGGSPPKTSPPPAPPKSGGEGAVAAVLVALGLGALVLGGRR